MSEKPFPESKKMIASKLVRQMIEANKRNERFCFILGAGASFESNIPTGNKLEKAWMDCLMGVADDRGTYKRDPEDTRILARDMKNDNLLEHDFSEIENAWDAVRKGEAKSIPSEYYFDIYRLRFDPDLASGYRYLESIMEGHIPSIGYYPLALLLTATNLNNLVITTNFESLVEDALFTYTNKKPLVAGHESEAAFIDVNLQRPIIAKVHRSLFYEPFNTSETTEGLRKEWQIALKYIFQNYTPVVIGYGGGDHSLMNFLKEESTRMRHGIYWCHLKSEFPDDRVQKLVLQKKGWLVQIDGFDALMLEIGKQMFGDMIYPTPTEKLLRKWSDERIKAYNEQWTKLNKEPSLEAIVEPLNQEEKKEEEKREQDEQLTFWDYMRRGERLLVNKEYLESIKEYNWAIKLEADHAIAYINRGYAYKRLEKYKEAIADYSRAIELMPNDAVAYNNRGAVYYTLREHEKAISDCTKAIEIDQDDAAAYNNRGNAYHALGKNEEALADYNKALELQPDYVYAYNGRGNTYRTMGKNDKAIEDYNKAIEVQPDFAGTYNNRGYAYGHMGRYEEAMADIAKALELQPENANAYDSRGFVHGKLEEYEKAIADFEKAIGIKDDDSTFYHHRAEVYRAMGKTELAEADEKKAKELEEQGK